MKEKMVKDCFSYTKGRCRALNSRKCDGCSFYKTIDQYKEGQKKAIDRILTLDKATRRNIMETYYGGKLEVGK